MKLKCWQFIILLCILNDPTMRTNARIPSDEIEKYFKMLESSMKRSKTFMKSQKDDNQIDFSVNKSKSFNSASRLRERDEVYIMTSKSCQFDVILKGDKIIGKSRTKRAISEGYLVKTPTKWEKRILTYKVYNHPASLSELLTRHAIFRAFKIWSRYSDLVFRETSIDDADFRVRFETGEHGDGELEAFDGPGGHLAHAHSPPSGEIHFDAEELWRLRSTKSRYTVVTSSDGNKSLKANDATYNLVLVAVHEIGHALGLRHTYAKNAIMYPLYSEKKNYGRVRLDKSDINALRLLYGNRTLPRHDLSPYATVQRAPTFIKSHRMVTSPDPCHTTVDAMYSANGVIYFFKDLYYWTWNKNMVSKVEKIRSHYLLSKPKVHASCFSEFSQRLYIFSGRKYWRYFDGRLETGYPRLVKNGGIPSQVDASLHIFGTPKIIIFKKQKYYIFDEIDEQVTQDAKSILPQNMLPLDSAVTISSTAYFVKNNDALRLAQSYLKHTFINGGNSNFTKAKFSNCVERDRLDG